MSHIATLDYNERLVRRAVLAFWRRTVGITFLVIATLTGVTLATLFIAGGRSFALGGMTAFLVFAVGIAALVYITQYTRSIRRLQALKQPKGTFTADDYTFSLQPTSARRRHVRQ